MRKKSLRSRRPVRIRSLGPFEVLEERSLLAGDSIELLESQALTGTTGEKPQSKVWTHGDQWWSVFADSAGTAVWRLDGATWTKVLPLRTGTYLADVKPVGDLAHILMERSSSSLLATIEYVPGAPGSYRAWTGRPNLLTSVPLSSSTETATLDLDSTGKLWVAFDTSTDIRVIHSTAPYTAWSSPVVLATNVSTDDIAAITSLPNGKVGVLWSNQTSERFGFRVHDDLAPPTQWSADEVPASQSALNVGAGMADDHLNIAVTSDGTLFAAVKTSYDTAGFTKIGLLVRRSDGQWDNLYSVDTEGTRPIVEISEPQNRLLVFYKAGDSSGPIVYKESLLSDIAFGSRVTLLADAALNNPSSVKHRFDDELVVIAGKSGSLAGALLVYAPRVNQAPLVNAGADQAALLTAGVQLDGTVTDDGLPAPPSSVTTTWSAISGPGTVTFDNSSAIDTAASFSQAGVYILRLSATDGEHSTTDDVSINVSAGNPVTVSFQNGVSAYAGMTDTRFRTAAPDTNYGNDTTLTVDASPEWSTLLRWDISAIPPGSLIVEATITTTITDASVNAFELYEVRRAWVETEATWNRASAGVPWGQPGATDESDRGNVVLGFVAATATGLDTTSLNADGRAALQAWVNDPSRNHGFIVQNYAAATDSLAFRSSEAGTTTRPKLEITYVPPGGGSQSNIRPAVDAGPDQIVAPSSSATLDATVTDDGLPNPPGSVTTTWSMVSGPGTVTFANPSAVDTTATFSQSGAYILRLSADDGELISTDDVAVNVTETTAVTKSFQDGVSSYAGTTDTRIRSSFPDENYGANTTLLVDASPPSTALFRWDLSQIPPGSDIVSATFTLTATEASLDQFEIYEVKRPWVENEATWNIASTGVPWGLPGASDGTDRGTDVLARFSAAIVGANTTEFNAAGLAVLEAFVNNPAGNLGLMIQNYTTAFDSFTFRSSEGTATARPKLEITYIPSGESAQASSMSPRKEIPIEVGLSPTQFRSSQVAALQNEVEARNLAYASLGEALSNTAVAGPSVANAHSLGGRSSPGRSWYRADHQPDRIDKLKAALVDQLLASEREFFARDFRGGLSQELKAHEWGWSNVDGLEFPGVNAWAREK